MGMWINSNSKSIWQVNYLNAGLAELYRSAEKLASGLRINSAADDPAGLVISERLRTQIASLTQEIENASATVNKYSSVSSTVQSLRSNLTDLRALAIGAANEAVNSEEAQQAYTDAANSIVTTYNQTAAEAEYNGQPTLDGSEGSLANVSELAGIDLSTAESAQLSIERIDDAIAELDAIQIDLGATQKNELESRIASLEVQRQNLIAAESQVRDVDYVEEYTHYVATLIRTQAQVAMMSHASLMGADVVRLLAT